MMKRVGHLSETRQLHLARTLQQVGALLTATLTLDEVFEHIFTLLAKVIDYDSVSIQLLDERGCFSLVAGRGFTNLERIREIVEGLAPDSIKIDFPDEPSRVIADTRQDEQWVLHEDTAYIRSWIGAALQIKGEMIGILNVDSATPNAYDSEDADTVAAFANQAAIAIENARLHEKTEKRAEELRVLHQIALDTSALVDLDALVQETTDLIVSRLQYDCFGFAMVDDYNRRLLPHPSFHGLPNDVIDKGVPLAQSVAQKLLAGGSPAVFETIDREDGLTCLAPNARSAIAVPVTAGQQSVGLLCAMSTQRRAFETNDLRFVTTLAGQLSGAIERAGLYSELQRHATHLADKVAEQTEELMAEKERTRAILENAGEGIFFASPTGIILYVNRAGIALTGYSNGEVLGRPLLQWLGEQAQAEEREVIQAAIDQGSPWSGEVQWEDRGGNAHDVRLTIAPIYEDDQELSGFVGVQSDISGLRQVERLKSRLIESVSHELRTPLTNIRTYLKLLHAGRDEKRDEYLAILDDQVQRLTHLIQELLDFSTSESLQIQSSPVDLAMIVAETLQSYRSLVERKGIMVCQSIKSDCPAVLGDRHQLLRVVRNLIGNALKYTPVGGEVTILARPQAVDQDGMVFFKVANSGPGISNEDLPYVFDEFYRGKESQGSNEMPGAGLGLAVIRQVVRRHGGTISVWSEPGEGASFQVLLPAAKRGQDLAEG